MDFLKKLPIYHITTKSIDFIQNYAIVQKGILYYNMTERLEPANYSEDTILPLSYSNRILHKQTRPRRFFINIGN